MVKLETIKIKVIKPDYWKNWGDILNYVVHPGHLRAYICPKTKISFSNFVFFFCFICLIILIIGGKNEFLSSKLS